jgi:hypothetical protein
MYVLLVLIISRSPTHRLRTHRITVMHQRKATSHLRRVALGLFMVNASGERLPSLTLGSMDMNTPSPTQVVRRMECAIPRMITQ